MNSLARETCIKPHGTMDRVDVRGLLGKRDLLHGNKITELRNIKAGRNRARDPSNSYCCLLMIVVGFTAQRTVLSLECSVFIFC